MATRRSRRRKSNSGLKALVGILAVVLIVVIVMAVLLPEKPDDTLQTDPSQNPTASTTASAPQPTDEPSQPTQPPRTGWEEQDGKQYYYDQGSPVSGIYTIDGMTYGFAPDGALLGAGWQEIGASRYYLNEDGTLYTGFLTLDEKLYYLRPDGTMARGEEEIDGVRWFFTSAGWQVHVVNPWNYVPEGYTVELIDLSSHYAVSDQRVDASCYDALLEMMDACMKAGHDVCVVSSYRTQAHQESLYNNQVIKQMNALGCTREEAEVIAATISAIPGTSEHQLGLAVDIIDTALWDLTEEQADLPGQQWLMENCWRYGFILRYPEDKTNETGIIYEPWHYRYVGVELATELHDLGQTLEAYMEGLD